MSDYVELRARSAFSFLRGASDPEDLVAEAARLGHDVLALADRNGVYGAPRFFQAARKAGLRAIVGADLALATGASLHVLVESRAGYRNLCRLLTQAKLRAPKGRATIAWSDLEEHAGGLLALAGGEDGPLAGAAAARDERDARTLVARLRRIFGERLFVDLQRHLDPEEERRNRFLADLAAAERIPLVATNDVRHATRERRRLLDVLTCIREKTTLDRAGRLLARNAERHLKPAREIDDLFRDVPDAVRRTRAVAERCTFTLADLGYRFPDYPLPEGTSADALLRELAFAGAVRRYGRITIRVRRQLEHELALVAKLRLAGYFLIVWDVVEFCRREGILVQGRGSAANSAVCYCLGITAVDAVGMDLLFERFLSEERGEWPDIDLDLPSGDRRERVIQYVYERYGTRGAAMTANVVTYRSRSAAREIAKALGFAEAEIAKLSKHLRTHGYVDELDRLAPQIRRAGLDPEATRVRWLVELAAEIEGLPRHLGQHSGGMVIAAGRLDEIVPLEPATMPGRVVVEWDKEDCADLGIIKVDLLGLGMMAVLEEAIPLVERHEGVALDLAKLPPDDPQVYASLRRADTIGVFQIESRAQMATLPRMKPERFYDLVVEVAIIRPGPIVGQMVHPYLARRSGREPVTYLHPSLEPILARTLGVPLFQEQLLRMAMTLADFTPGEAEELRRAMGFKRSRQRMTAIERKLRDGMARNGITGETQETIVRSITSFALYGFPECVVGETRVIDADTGRWVRIEDVAEGNVSIATTIACDTDLRLRRRRIRRAIRSGAKPTLRMRTALGKEIVATAEHPFLTIEGWRTLGELSLGDAVAVARSLPPLGEKRWPRHRAIVLAGLLAEGNLCHPSTFYFYTTSAEHRDEFVAAVERFSNTQATVRVHRNCFSVHVRRREPCGRIGAAEWIRELGLWGRNSHEKFFPQVVFELDAASLGLFLARLWEGDGHVSCAGHASYDTVSRRLADDVQHALLGLGIVARVYERTRPYRDRTTPGFTVTVTGRANLESFRRGIAKYFLDPRKRAAVDAIVSGEGRLSSRDVIPIEIRALIRDERVRRGVAWERLGAIAGISTRAICSPGRDKRGYRRWVIGALAASLESPALERLASSDLYWDRIVAIEAAGVRETYDLEIEGDHNFLANDFVVHNSHSASFALLAYASAYLKVHHPAAFLCAMLNQWPLGFYHPATLVKDAQRHGVRVRPVDATRSGWLCALEPGERGGRPAVRLGFRYVRGLREEAGQRIEHERARAPFASLADFARRTALRESEIESLAHLGAFAAFGRHRRDALWQVAALERDPTTLLAAIEPRADDAAPLAEMTPIERTLADYGASGMTVGPHVVRHLRPRLEARGVTPAAALPRVPDGRVVRIAGHVIVRQRPGTAKGFLFLTIEDETGISNAVVTPSRFERWRSLVHSAPLLLVEGPVQNVEGVIHVRAERFEALPLDGDVPPSHDFH